MARRLRFVPAGSLVEITARTVQGRFLLKPHPGWTEIFVGILARAQKLFPLKIHAFVALSGHFHLLVTPDDAPQLAAFMNHVLTNVSKEAGRRHDWRGPMFERRYQAILVTDEEAAHVERLKAGCLPAGFPTAPARRPCRCPSPPPGNRLSPDRRRDR